MRAPFLLGIVEVIAIPCLTRFFGARLLPFGACATAKARHDEEGEKPDNFQAGECVFHFFFLSLKMAQRRNPRLSNEGAAYRPEGHVGLAVSKGDIFPRKESLCSCSIVAPAL